ncbi:hypothetical protein Tsubulata_045088 [Turnera subulata]|uniref:Uncharacterized protein n=1 Tax=Turnera subulata TaxID=218843 RepID=A0A9Q0JQ91_9ROSI|nr:hypothetical protein Tsubulata_045088 [Turnera subulata]
MAQQEEGWPLGLQPLNARALTVAGVGEFHGSRSFNTLLTGSPASFTDSSSDLDTESTASFFHEKSITLGSLIGVSNALDLSRKPAKVTKVEAVKEKKSCRTKLWPLSLCSRDTTTTGFEIVNNPAAPSLGHFLAVERSAANDCSRRNQGPIIYGLDELNLAQPVTETNSLFIDGQVAPWYGADAEIGGSGRLGHGVQELCSCICGQGQQPC